MNNFSIIVDCPDSYLDILKVFFLFLSKNWPDRKNTIYVTTQNEIIESPENVVFVKCGDNLNSISRAKEAIKLIKDDFFLTLDCDDYISSPVDNSVLETIVDYMSVKELRYVRLWETKNREQKKYKTDLKNLYLCNKKARYSKSLMANIWKKSEFLAVFSDDKADGWTVEADWLEEVYFNKKGFYDRYCYYDKNPLNILHAISKGKWIRKSYRKIKKAGISDELLSKRGKLPLKLNFKYAVSMFLFDHLPSSLFLFIKKIIPHKRKTYTTKY